MALEDLGVFGESLARLRDRLVEAALGGGRARLLEQVVELDLVLGVAARPVLEVPRAHGAADVAEGLEPLGRLGVHRFRQLRRPAAAGGGEHLLEGALERLHAAWVGSGEVGRLEGIALQVVELAARGADQLEALVLDRPKLAPAVVEAREPALRERHEIEPLPARERQQARALHGRRSGDPQQLQQRRHHVDDADLVRDHAWREARRRHHQRDAHGGVVDEEAVGQLAVLAQHLAVVAEHGHHRAPQASVGLERVEHAPELRVGGGDLGVVGAFERARKLRRVLPRRGVGGVRVVEVDPEEERPLALRREPAQRLVHRLVPRALDRVHPRLFLEPAQVEVVEVALEALVDAPARVEHEGRDEPSGPEAAGLQDLGERLLLLAQVVAAVVADGVAGGEGPGEERGVRRQRERHDGGRAGEAQSARGEAVEAGRPRSGVAVAADVVGPQRVQRHDQQVARAAAAEPRGGQGRASQPEQDGDPQGQDERGGEEGSAHQTRFWCGGTPAGNSDGQLSGRAPEGAVSAGRSETDRETKDNRAGLRPTDRSDLRGTRARRARSPECVRT